jgi:hypothetical protein
LGVPKDSKSPTLEVLGFTPTLGQNGVATDVISEDNQPQELVPCETEDKEGDEIVQNNNVRVVM